MNERSAFAGGDQDYLQNVQYGNNAKLASRVALHERFSTAAVAFPDFAAGLIPWGDEDRVLECGCGTGRFWENSHTPRSTSLTVTDLSSHMFETAQRHATTNGFTNVVGQQMDVQDLSFDADTFDVVVANHMLYHVPDPDQAITELARVLRPEGFLIASTNGYGHMGEMNDAVASVFGEQVEGLYEVFGIESGEARLREQFKTISWHAYDNDLLVDDPEAAIAYGLSYPPGESATDEQADAFADAIRRRFVDGQFRIHVRTGAFVCSDPR